MPAVPAPSSPAAPPAAARWSLRRRMLLVGLALALAAWTTGGLAFYLADAQADRELRDSRLMHLANTLAAFADHELAEVAADRGGTVAVGVGHVERATAMDERYLYQIWLGPQQLLLRSHAAPAAPALVPSFAPGFGDGRFGDQALRTYALATAHGQLQVQVAERLLPRSLFGGAMQPALVGTMLLSLAAVAALAVWLVVRALQPVRALAEHLRSRPAQETTPLVVQDLPAELQPLVASLNSLLARIGERLSRERGFTALAAHELRTPLAALRLQAQVAQRETDPERRDRQLRALTGIADRCDHLLSQLLTLARLEQDVAAAPPECLALDPLVEEVLDDLAPLIARRQARVDLQLQVPRLSARREAVQMLLRNLLENALLHAGAAARVTVSSLSRAGRTVLQVDDNGPGIDEADRVRVFDRFVRLQRSAGTAGSGLGLSIVRTVAEAHGASVALLAAPGGGLRVELSFPDAPVPGDSPAPAP